MMSRAATAQRLRDTEECGRMPGLNTLLLSIVVAESEMHALLQSCSRGAGDMAQQLVTKRPQDSRTQQSSHNRTMDSMADATTPLACNIRVYWVHDFFDRLFLVAAWTTRSAIAQSTRITIGMIDSSVPLITSNKEQNP